MLKTILAIISIVLLLVGDVPYIVNTIKRKTRPHLFSWLVWSILNVVNFLILLNNGGGQGSIVALIRTLSTLLIFFLSIRNGLKDIKKWDIFFLILSLVTLVIWYNLTDPIYAAILSSLTNALSIIPTVVKTWKEPKSETLSLYAANIVRQTTFVFSIASMTATTITEPLVSLFLNLIMTVIIISRSKVKLPTKKASNI